MRFANLFEDERRLFAVMCCILLLRGAAPVQAQAQAPSPQAMEGVSAIEIAVMSGVDRVNDDVSNWEIAVEVHDDRGRRVKGAIVVFQLPQGAGTFIGGSTVLTVVTDDMGRAVARGFRRGPMSGPFQVTVTASLGQLKASAVVNQVNPKLSFMATPKKWYVVGGAAAAVGLGLGIWISGRGNPATLTVGPGSVTPVGR